MALAHFGRDISHPPRVPLEAVFNSLKAGIGGIWEKQRPESARVIWKSIYYAKMTKIVNLGLDQQFSPNNKVFFLNRYFQKKCCSFSFLRPKFSLGMLFRQFGNFPMSSCGPTVQTFFLKITTNFRSSEKIRYLFLWWKCSWKSFYSWRGFFLSCEKWNGKN